jgi:uncharacterized ferritin-like protein (DUF455 family)
MEFFAELEKILQIADPYEKIAHFNHFYEKFQKSEISFDHTPQSLVFNEPSYAAICKVVDPTQVPRRSKFATKEGRAVLLHAIAHIEYSAIDLALDAAYRFKRMPQEFYEDWLEVAADECRHFLMIEELLKELGFGYGDFVVHKGLFEAGRATLSLKERMAVVPRYLEANGLDANPKIMTKLKKFNDPFVTKMLHALEIILHEEIEHVHKGDRWFRWACEKEGITDIEGEYFAIVERIYPGTIHSKPFVNVEARKRAGFSCSEIKKLARENVSC